MFTFKENWVFLGYYIPFPEPDYMILHSNSGDWYKLTISLVQIIKVHLVDWLKSVSYKASEKQYCSVWPWSHFLAL